MANKSHFAQGYPQKMWVTPSLSWINVDKYHFMANLSFFNEFISLFPHMICV